MGVQRQRWSVFGGGTRGASAARDGAAAPEQPPPGRRRVPGSAEGTARPSACARFPPSLPLPRGGTALCPLALPPAHAAPLHWGSGRLQWPGRQVAYCGRGGPGRGGGSMVLKVFFGL